MNARGLLTTLCSLFVVFGLVGSARADKPNSAFAGKIMLSDKRFPQSGKSLADFNSKIKKQAKTNFQEDKEKGEWHIYFAGFLKAPLNDVEYLVKIYEIGKGGNQLLSSFEQFTDTRGMTSLVSNMILEKKTIGVNKQLMMTMESKGKVLCSARFKILGEGEKMTGKVDFSEDDANGKDEE